MSTTLIHPRQRHLFGLNAFNALLAGAALSVAVVAVTSDDVAKVQKLAVVDADPGVKARDDYIRAIYTSRAFSGADDPGVEARDDYIAAIYTSRAFTEASSAVPEGRTVQIPPGAHVGGTPTPQRPIYRS